MPTTNPIRKEYQPLFDEKRDEWVLRVPEDHVKQRNDGAYEVRLPLYLTRTYLPVGGAILRPMRLEYRNWILSQQKGKCAICKIGPDAVKGRWTLDHQPPLSADGSKFIDYERKTKNQVIHQGCDESQTRR
jgi:hypothetical protein